MDKHKIGASWEEAVACYLKNAGVTIVERNYRCSQGEIDIIGFHQDCLVFFEVKYRKNEAFGTPQEAVDRRKQAKICRCAEVYLYRQQIQPDRRMRFDVVAVCGEDIRWIRNAFAYRRSRV